MMSIRFFVIAGMAVAMLFGTSDVSRAQGSVAYSYVANTAPPDAFLALKTYPSVNSPRIMAMANGTKLDVLLRRLDGWWYVKVWPTGEEGWAFSGQGSKAWILCCAGNDGSQTEAKSAAKEITDFTCDQLWFGRNSIFKEAGYCFKTPRAIAAFGNAGCLYDEIDAVRLSTENQNFAEAIQRAERVKACPR
jgi:YARHG domain